jgi:UDP-N-acetylglucosamine/UDP-N-acetylgalactosamine diphosphorylase
VKFETFVFDALPRARRTVVVEASRAEEFSPVKNATGVDSPETTQADLLRLFRGWIEAAGFEVGAEDAVLEISPLFAQDREEFQARVRKAGQICGERLYLA